VGCGVVGTLATPTALLLGVLLCPLVLALVLDRRPDRPAARPLLLCGLAATMHPLFRLWRDGHTLEIAVALLMDAGVLATAWAAQAAGWLAAELTPLLVALTLEARSQARAARLRADRVRYEAEWDIPPAPTPSS
jgi:hypothetical protein